MIKAFIKGDKMWLSLKTKVHSSYGYLFLGFVFLFFFNGRWILPIAAYLAPISLIRFLRYQKPLKGFFFLSFAMLISNIFIWQGQIPISGLVYYIMTLMMSLSTSLVFIVDRIYSRRLKGIVSTFMLPSMYVLMEYITVSTNPSGTYGALSNTQSSLPLLQLISITGTWGVTFIILWTASVINWLWDHAFSNYVLRKALWVYVVPMMMIILYGQIRLSHKSTECTVRIASINLSKMEIQHLYGSHPDSIKDQINSSFLHNCHNAALSGAKIVFGVEAMLNMASDKEDEYLAKAKAAAQKDNMYIGLPLLIYPINNPDARPMNKILWISPTGEILFTYYKAKPTPGEGSYGDGIIRYFDSPYGRMSSAICFDMDFPSLFHQVHSMNIDIMLVPGNDWKDITPYHTYASSIRAIEQGFNLVRAASRGLSASFTSKGELISSQNYFTSNDIILYSDVPMKGSHTFYGMVGDLFAWLCILFFVSISIYAFMNRDREEQQ
jgi:apolipoprotein N-acyltransferase